MYSANDKKIKYRALFHEHRVVRKSGPAVSFGGLNAHAQKANIFLPSKNNTFVQLEHDASENTYLGRKNNKK